ncbi:four helix bundle protein [Patescibacteria group bacterium]
MNKKDKIEKFTDLLAWQEGHNLVLLIYEVTKRFPKDELYSLTNQIRRSAVSVTSNIAEGFGKLSYKEKLHYYYNTHGSLIELKNQIIIAKDVGYITNKIYNQLMEAADCTHRLLQGLIKSTKNIIYS